MTSPVNGSAPREAVLDRVLELETQLEARLAAARQEADSRVAAAEALVEQRFAALDAELLAARVASDRHLSEVVGERLRMLEALRDTDLQRMERIAREEVDSLAHWMAGAVIAGIENEARP